MPEGKIKILYTIPNFDTAGSGRVVFDLARNLDKSRFDVEIACMHDRGEFFRVVKASGLKIHITEFTRSYRPYWTLPARIQPVMSFFRKHKFDLVHSWHWSSDWTEALACRLAGVPWLYTKKAMGWGNVHWKIRSRLATKIICINRDMEKEFFPGWKKLALIPIGVDTEHFVPSPPEESRQYREKLGLRKDDFVILSVANLVPVKGIELVIDAIERLRLPNVRYVVVGDHANDYGSQLLRNVHERGLDTYITFIGKVLDVRPFLALADVFVIPTKDEGRKEGLPVAPIEAMACGKIVIGSRISGIKDLLDEYPELLFEPGNVDEICKRILYIMNLQDGDSIALSRQLRSKVEEKYSLQGFIAAHEQLYTRIAQ